GAGAPMFWRDGRWPQCRPSSSSRACCTFLPVGVGAIPSIVVIAWPTAAPAGITHDRRGMPSRCTVQAPHKATPQPNFVPFMPIRSRRTQRSGISGSASTLCDLPLIFSVSIAVPPLAESDLADVDGHHQHFTDGLSVGSARVGATFRRQPDAVCHHVIRGQLRRREPARDVHAIVVAAQHQILAEEEILDEAVRLDGAGKTGAQHAPRLEALAPWLGLLDLHAVQREKKGRGEIGPESLAVEVGTMERVPRRAHLMTGKRVSGSATRGDQRAIELLDGDPGRREHRALIGSAVGPDRRPLLVQPHGHAARAGILPHSLEREKASAAHDRSLHLLVSVPTLHASVSVDDPGKKLVHRAQADFIAARTFWGVNGTERRRAPVASKIALAIAAGTMAV